MARQRDGTRPLSGHPAARPPAVREFSAGGLVYRRRDGEWVVVLAGRRLPDGGDIVWGLPKGHVEPGETMADTALRRRRPAALASTAAVDYTAILTRLAADQPEVRARAT